MKTEDSGTHNQYLTFVIANEEYAVAILKVKEIIAYDEVTRVPRTAPYIRGMINLRGSVVPVIDLALKFGFGATAITRSTCIVIVEVTIDAQPTVIGVLVDAVSQVVDVSADDIEPPPQFGTLRVDFLGGMARSASSRKFVLILDIDGVVTTEDDITAIAAGAGTHDAGAAAVAPA